LFNILDTEAKHLDYAGFITRLLANIIDGLIFLVVLGLPLFVIGAAGASEETVKAATGVLYLLAIVGGWIYEAMMHSSSKQATLGKMALGIKVADLEGKRISFGRATARYLGKWLSGLICNIGYLIAAFTPKKQALHDIIASTVVVRN
jgi:uncharacterized RDD family membrane protein YckC